MKKYGTAIQATDDNIIWLMPFRCCVTKASDTLSICGTYCFLSARMVLQCTISVIHDNTLYWIKIMSKLTLGSMLTENISKLILAFLLLLQSGALLQFVSRCIVSHAAASFAVFL